jgi:hypothetical protein
MTGLYFQPSPKRANDDSLPTAPDQRVDVSALIDQLINRIEAAERKIEYKVDRNSLAKILLTDRDVVIQGDQVNILGQVNIADWVRDISGNPTGGIDATSLTRITGGKVQTGIIESFNWSTTTGSQINLDTGTIVTGGSASPKFSVSAGGVLTCQEAVVTGTLTAGSFIQSSVQLDDEFGVTLGDIAAGVDIQAALDAGVTNILAGVGSNFVLDVSVSDGYAVFRHKDAVFLGTASAGSNKVGMGLSAGGIAIGYNRSSDGAWQTKITLDSSGNVSLTGTLTAGSVITNSVTVDGVTLSTIASNASSGKSISDALLVSGTSVLKGVLVPTDSGALKTGTITWNATTGALTGGTGIAMTEFGLIGANSGTSTFSLSATTGALTLLGNITGGSNINISGSAKFDGLTSVSGSSYTMSVNESLGQDNGIYVVAKTGGNAAIEAIGSGSSDGVDGTTATGFGVSGFATGAAGIGVVATNSAGGTALQIVGKMTISSSTLVTNLNADTVDGVHASALAKLSGGNTFSGDQTLSNNLTVTGLVRCGNLRIDQAIVSGSATATAVLTGKPGSNSSSQWGFINWNGTTKYILLWD